MRLTLKTREKKEENGEKNASMRWYSESKDVSRRMALNSLLSGFMTRLGSWRGPQFIHRSHAHPIPRLFISFFLPTTSVSHRPAKATTKSVAQGSPLLSCSASNPASKQLARRGRPARNSFTWSTSERSQLGALHPLQTRSSNHSRWSHVHLTRSWQQCYRLRSAYTQI
ncbi:hypothetical protein BDN72DRAFT_338381 [Pluteus cervinus]|uniref:Uncharacterized protein n=1 Tax=Pluteus cervinus TaxID=181527 RepID=A0ACD3ABU5_9AGAR|nr:hypothetical protein BDN72DRAFT_338381 [Pluteus cervinus]